MFFLHQVSAHLKFTHVKIYISRSFIFHPISMKFWLKTPNNIYKNSLNSHIDKIMFTVSKLEIKKVTIQVEHPVQKLSFSNFQHF